MLYLLLDSGVPVFRTQIASASYSQLASTLSGLVIAAIILLLQSKPSESRNQKHRKSGLTLTGMATLSLLVALFGSILSSLNYAIISGYNQEIDYPQIHTAALFTGAGFSLSILIIFCAIVIICRAFLDEMSARAAQLIVLVSGFGATIFLNVNVYAYQDSRSPNDIALPNLILPIVLCLIAYFSMPFLTMNDQIRRFLEGWAFKQCLFVFSAVMSAYTIAALFAPMTSSLDAFPVTALHLVAFFQSFLFGLMICTIPSPENKTEDLVESSPDN